MDAEKSKDVSATCAEMEATQYITRTYGGIDFKSEIDKTDREICYYKEKLKDCRQRYECVEMKIYGVKQLKDKTSIVLSEIERKNDNLEKDLKEIHGNYAGITGNADYDNDGNDKIYANLSGLTAEKDRLKKDFLEMKKRAESNDKKLMKVNKLIAAQNKHNIMLIKRLKRMSEGTVISEDLKGKISAVLSDPRNIGSKELAYNYIQQENNSE